MKKLLGYIYFYAVYYFLILCGYKLHKVRAWPVLEDGLIRAYIQVGDGKGRVVDLKKKDWLVFFRNWKGGIRRQFILRFRKGYARKQLLLRKGNCERCGLCCCEKKCPFLIKEDGTWDCILHPYKPLNCMHYPVDQKDVEKYACKGFRFMGFGSNALIHRGKPRPKAAACLV